MQVDQIAIVGCAVRLPGVDSLTSMWQTMVDLVDVSSDTPRDRYDAQRLHRPHSTPGGVIATRGYYIAGVDEFDAAFFGIDPMDADLLDPQQRIVLQLVWMALEDAGIPPATLRGSTTNVVIGSAHTDYWDNIIRRGLHTVPGEAVMNVRSMLAGRVSYHYDLRGASITLDTACSSSLVGVQLAKQALLSGEADTCIVGGVNLKLNEYQDVVLSQIPVLSPEGKCRFADADADGFVAADGAGVLILRRSSDAVRDGNRVRAIIRSAIVTNDGARGGSATAPAIEAHVELLTAAMNSADVVANDIDFIEAHGPGAPMIDRMELEALDAVFGRDHHRDRPLFISSGKSVFGHSEAAAGVMSLTRAILSLEKRTALPSNHIRRLNPAIDWSTSNLHIPREPTALEGSGRLIAGVSAQGISSVNAHVLLETPPPPARRASDVRTPLCLAVSGPTRISLERLVTAYRRFLSEMPDAATLVVDFAWTALVGREVFHHRVVFVGDTLDQIVLQMQSWTADPRSECVVAPHADSDSADTIRAARAFIADGERQPLASVIARGNIISIPGYQWSPTKHWLPNSATPTAGLVR